MIADYPGQSIAINRVMPDLKASSRKQVFQFIAPAAAQDSGLSGRELFDRLLDRERQASSGIGEGVAIPHLRVPLLNSPYTLFTRLPSGIDFHAVDDRPVDLLCLLLSPDSDGPRHLRRLARISRLFRNKPFCQRLREAPDPGVIHKLLAAGYDDQMAA